MADLLEICKVLRQVIDDLRRRWMILDLIGALPIRLMVGSGLRRNDLFLLIKYTRLSYFYRTKLSIRKIITKVRKDDSRQR